jgi:hypothetical protein
MHFLKLSTFTHFLLKEKKGEVLSAVTKVKRPIQYILQKLRLFALDRFQSVHVDSDEL